jgi:hypothetical protein
VIPRKSYFVTSPIRLYQRDGCLRMTPLPMVLCACSSLLLHILMLNFARWDGEEAITHYLLHICDDVIVLGDAVGLDERHLRWCPSVSMNKSRMAEWILMTFVVNVMPFDANKRLYLLMSKIWWYQCDGCQSSEVRQWRCHYTYIIVCACVMTPWPLLLS